MLDQPLVAYLAKHLLTSGLNTQSALARASGIDVTYINRIFKGRILRPEIETLEKIAPAINRPIAEIMAAAGYPAPHDAPVRNNDRPPRTFNDVAQLLKDYADQQVEARLADVTTALRLPIVNALSAQDAGNLGRQVADTIEVPSWLVEGVGKPVLFVVSGDCLTADGLWTGDLVIIDQGVTDPHDGEIVAARVNGEETLKHYHHLGDRVELRPSSPGFKPIIVREGEVEIIGVYAGVMRRAGRGRR